MTRLAESGRRYAILDALTDAHLVAIGEAAAAHPLLVGGSGIAMGLPENLRRAGLLPSRDDADVLPPMRGHGAVLAGSCSRATLGQIGFARDHLPVLELDPLTQDGPAMVAAALGWVDGRLREDRPVVIATSAMPDRVALLQRRLGREAAGAMVEEALAAIAEGLVERGVGRLVVAGGESSGAVVQRLGVRSLRIGGEIAPGVPWTFADPPGLHLALKSGNFGGRDMFLRAFEERP